MKRLLFLFLSLISIAACNKGEVWGNGQGYTGRIGRPSPGNDVPAHQIVPPALLNRKELFQNKKFYQFKNTSCTDGSGKSIATYDMALEFTSDMQIKRHGNLCSNESSLADKLDEIQISDDGAVLGYGANQILEVNAAVDETKQVDPAYRILSAWCLGRDDNRRLTAKSRKGFLEQRFRKSIDGNYSMRQLYHFWDTVRQAVRILDFPQEFPMVMSVESPFTLFSSLGFRWHAGWDPETETEIWSVTDYVFKMELADPPSIKGAYPASYTYYDHTTETTAGGDLRCYVTK